MKKKTLSRVIVYVLISSFLFSCAKKEVKVEPKKEEVVVKDEVYILRNPYTTNYKVINEKNEVILDTSSNSEDCFVSLVRENYNGKPMCILKEINGEEKITEYYEYEGEKHPYEIPSTRVEIYDLNGKKIDFNKKGVSYISFGFGDNIFYANHDKQKSYAYNLKTGVEKELGGENCIVALDKVFSSDYGVPGKEYKIAIYDKDLNLVKTIDGYSFDCELDYNEKKCVRISTYSQATEKHKYNYLDENLNFLYDAPVDQDGFEERRSKDPDYLEDAEYDAILLKLQEIDPSIQFFQKVSHDGIILYMVDHSYEDPETHEWVASQRIFGADFKEKKGDFKTVQRAYSKSGYILVDHDTFLDFNLNVVKKFDRKSEWQEDEKYEKVFLYDNCDEKYNSRDSFNLYDKDFNVVLENIKRINISMIPEYIVAEDATGTKLYDKDFKISKDYGRSLEIYGWGEKSDSMHSFIDNDTNLYGVMDKNWNIVIDNLKHVSDMKETFFTFQKGFKYGFMDYNGNVLIEFSIFDNSTEDMTVNEIITTSYPRVDGSTANMPMMAQIRADYLGENLTDSENMVNVTTTDYAWRNLIEGKNDLLLVYEPSSETKKLIEESGVKLKITPIGVDALVFIENKDNPVNDLKTTDLQNIYEGKVTNWKEVGGEDKKIEAFQRPLNSGSQTLFLNLLMKDKTPMEAKKEYRPEGMDDLIEVVASYKNTSNALGYSVFYYAKKMYQNPNLKLIAVDGVFPSDESIASGEYPFLNEYYLVIREDTKEDSETMKLYNFILSDKGTEAIKKAGYIPIQR